MYWRAGTVTIDQTLKALGRLLTFPEGIDVFSGPRRSVLARVVLIERSENGTRGPCVFEFLVANERDVIAEKVVTRHVAHALLCQFRRGVGVLAICVEEEMHIGLTVREEDV